MTRTFPREERFSLTDQILRSSRGVSALIAEAWARRRYAAAFSEKLYQAMAETLETQAWLNHAHACGYISSEERDEHHHAWEMIGGKLYRMIQKSTEFGRRLR